MNNMFGLAGAFNQDISNWSVSQVITMMRMFWDATNFNQDLSKWDVSRVTDMKSMFERATSFDQDPVSYTHLTLPTICSV